MISFCIILFQSGALGQPNFQTLYFEFMILNLDMYLLLSFLVPSLLLLQWQSTVIISHKEIDSIRHRINKLIPGTDWV